MIEVIISLIVAFLGIIGVQGFILRRRKAKVETLETQVEKEKKQADVYKEVVGSSKELNDKVKEVEKEYEELEEKLTKAETSEDIIAVANDIIDRFNRVQGN